MKPFVLLLLFFCCLAPAFSQKALQVLITRGNGFKKYEVFKDDDLTYKAKGRLFYRTARITNMNDSVLLLNDSVVLLLREIKKIKLNNRAHILETLTGAAFIGGTGYLILNGANNLILNNVWRIDARAGIVASSFLGTALILKQIGYKRVKIRRGVTLRVIQTSYHFNAVPQN